MVGSDRVPSPNDYQRAFGREAIVSKFRDRARGFVCAVLFPAAWPSPGLREESRTKPSAKERSSTELRFASFLAPLCRVGRAVKDRDERPKTGRP